jgi:hypothetical protein
MICLIFPCVLGTAITFGSSPDEYWIKFDEYSDISWKQETKRLANFIFQLRNMKNAHAYLVVYGGRRSCKDEARLRGERVKSYIAKSGALSGEHITILDAGYREQWSIALEIGYVGTDPLTREIVRKIDPGILGSQVKILQRCENALYRKL